MTKIDLKDLTFIIPFRCDSNHRFENLEIIVNYLNHHFDTNILVKETSKKSFLEDKKIIENVKYFWEYSDSPIFHRTKVLNDMLEMVETKFVANYDVDCLFPVKSYIETIEALRSGKVFVFPYLGSFMEIPRKFIPEIKNKMEVDWINLKECGENHPSSVGGSMFINTEIYRQLGGESEVFSGWGAEDNFRTLLFQKFGYEITRVGTVLYHLEHYRGINSSPHHEHYNNNMNMFFRATKMNKEELKSFVNSYNRFK